MDSTSFPRTSSMDSPGFAARVDSAVRPAVTGVFFGAAGGRVPGGELFPVPSAWGSVLKKCSIDRRQTSFPPSNRGMIVPRPLPAARNLPASSGFPMVADRPIRRGVHPASRQRRSIRQKVCPPRSARRREWISSITMKRRSRNRDGISICLLIIRDSRDSGVIWRIPAGFFMSFLLRDRGASPCQRVTGIAASSHSSSRRPNWSLIRALSGAM